MIEKSEEAIYQRFINGALVYKPSPNRDDRNIILPIVALGNPLEGTFDLSQCGDAGKYLSISTGYRKGKKAENASKVEIWFAPRFLIEKELKSRAGHFQDIFFNWKDTAPVGIFWTWGNWEVLGLYDYLTTEDLDNLSKINLYQNWEKCTIYSPYRGSGTTTHDVIHRDNKFYVQFHELK